MTFMVGTTTGHTEPSFAALQSQKSARAPKPTELTRTGAFAPSDFREEKVVCQNSSVFPRIKEIFAGRSLESQDVIFANFVSPRAQHQ
jgi:hypothetical protein